MHQNLAVILWQLNDGKKSFIVLIPGHILFFETFVSTFKMAARFLSVPNLSMCESLVTKGIDQFDHSLVVPITLFAEETQFT